MVFGNYSKYYDLLYKDKDYEKESEYIIDLIKKYSIIEVKNILDIGCGTGIHSQYLMQKGYSINGIDVSSEMIEIAKKKENDNLKFFICDATNFNLNKKYDVVLSLFHVISYQTTNNDINNFFKNVSKHLIDKGLFIFDCWYGPAVLTLKPEVRIKRIENNEIKVTRLAEPVIYPNQNTVDVNYEIIIYDKIKNLYEIIKETHKMRYFFYPELEYILNNNNFKIIHFEEWLTGNLPGFNSWGITFICKKN